MISHQISCVTIRRRFNNHNEKVLNIKSQKIPHRIPHRISSKSSSWKVSSSSKSSTSSTSDRFLSQLRVWGQKRKFLDVIVVVDVLNVLLLFYVLSELLSGCGLGLVVLLRREDLEPGAIPRERRGDPVRPPGEAPRRRGATFSGRRYPRDSSRRRDSCSSSRGSSSGSVATLVRDWSNMERMSAMSSPARTLRLMYCWRLRISWESWSFRVDT